MEFNIDAAVIISYGCLGYQGQIVMVTIAQIDNN